MVAFAFVGCEKDPTIAKIQVVELATGNAVPNAIVKLYVPQPPAATKAGGGFTTKADGFITDKTYTADALGNVSVELSLEATISIDAKNSDSSKSGTGVIACQRYKTTSVVVKIQ